ncbi:MAG: undecaprenyl-diphosphate phosphatase [Halieaceae bacterium]|nr:undecaprenyl-diphosphate phosphatase [Halieaceae bacterium]
MDWLQALALAALQGLTEFLPISSSAHLILPSKLLGWDDQGLAFDIAVHVGTLLAVLLYYRRDLIALAQGTLQGIARREINDEVSMVWYLALASVPVALVGLAGESLIAGELRSILVIATTTVVFGVLLGWSDWYNRRLPSFRPLSLPIAIGIGLAQAVAPIPGVSRSGITITAALFLGLDRHAAARFSFLLSIPVIAGAGLIKTLELLDSGVSVDWPMLAFAVAVAALTAYACIAAFLRLLDRIGLMPFVYYRFALGLALFVVWWM